MATFILSKRITKSRIKYDQSIKGKIQRRFYKGKI